MTRPRPQIVKPIRRRRFIIGFAAASVAVIEQSPAFADVVRDGDVGTRLKNMRQSLAELRRGEQMVLTTDLQQLQDLQNRPSSKSITKAETILRHYTLFCVTLDAKGFGVAIEGRTHMELSELGWRTLLVRIENPARLEANLVLISPSIFLSPTSMREGSLGQGIHGGGPGNDVPQIITAVPDPTAVAREWIGYEFGASAGRLSGSPVEYHLLQIYCQTGNPQPMRIGMCAEKASPSRRQESKTVQVSFTATKASTVSFNVKEETGEPTFASFVVTDNAGRLYPAPAHRLEPDLTYQPQIYRGDGENVRLPPGQYDVVVSRGPEYFPQRLTFEVGNSVVTLAVVLRRWIDPAKFGWYGGDTHIHPEGQAFGSVSSRGLTPETMYRQASGEGLHVGAILIWEGGYYYEKQFLTGHVYKPIHALPFPELQKINNSAFDVEKIDFSSDAIVRWDVEQAVFPSNHFCHPVLLGLKNHDYPGATGLNDWPSWNLPILKWAKAQGAVVGYAHVGGGMWVNAPTLPNYEIPEINDAGGTEAVVDVAHDLVEFLSGTENDPKAELNIWYHLLNCGFKLPMIGETDFGGGAPRAGSGRTYVRQSSPPKGDAGYAEWLRGVAGGALYFGDGRSHIIDFSVDGTLAGQEPIQRSRRAVVRVTARVAALLAETPVDPDNDMAPTTLGYWHIERGRIPNSRNVTLEVVVNSLPVATKTVIADGRLNAVALDLELERSSWIALRILPSSHTAPVFVEVGGKPVRASRRSAKWCGDYVTMLWSAYSQYIRASEREDAKRAYMYAAKVYRSIFEECDIE